MSTQDDAQRHARSKALLFAALDLTPDEREAFLERSCRGEPELLADVRSLLAEFTRIDGFLEEPLRPRAAPATCPDRLGSYRVLRVLGHGGMGVVYLAEQPSPRRRVALKVLRLDAATEAARARFTREGEVLARCHHPGIAQIHAALVVETDVGLQPMICMEYVDGRPIVEYARGTGLDSTERIELFLQVAEAVAHAHEQGVLHRDLKPDNVLVDEEGRARVLDFGVAHVVGDEATFATRTGQVLGTVAYMSPEQARGGRIDERADVYSLGVILYELLTGSLPLDTRGALVHEALRTLAEEDAVPLSRRDPTMRGDLETVLSKALASEPARRYRSVRELSDDLSAFLEGRPIAARPPSPFYVLSKFAARHRALSAAVALAILALGGGAVIALQALTRVEQQTGFTELFADRKLLDDLVAEADDLWPADSTRVAAMDAWLARARDAATRLDQHRERVDAIAAAGAELDQGAAVDPAWLLAEGRALIAGVEELIGPGGALERIEARRAEAAALRRVTIDAHREAWDAAAARVAADARFRLNGFALAPQEGLVPLGPDPESGLEEFAHYGATGDVPHRDPATGLLALDDDSAVVLVLVPGGEVRLGDPAEEYNGEGFERVKGEQVKVMRNQGPPITVRLDPYLIGKHEMTQGQFLRASGSNPSDHGIGDEWFGRFVGSRNPVESVSWEQAAAELARLGLELPTEAQWEAAARAGSEHAFLGGRDGHALAGLANLRARDGFADDGHYTHAPAGSFAPNAYGLHDVIGNVWELCRDTYKVRYHSLEHRDGDGLVIAEPDGDVSRRGSGWTIPPHKASVFVRQDRRFGSPDTTTGFRALWTLRASRAHEGDESEPAERTSD